MCFFNLQLILTITLISFHLTGLECPNCVLQWRYIAGNNWGMCEDGTGAVGCGPQEEFRACADITVGDKGPAPPLRPVRPGIKTTPRGKITDATRSTTRPDTEETFEEPAYDGSRLMGTMVIILSTLLLVLCILAAIYLYHYHGQRVKQFMHWNQHHQKTGLKTAPTPVVQMNTANPPVAPPRAKRLSQTLQDINPYESSVVNGFSR